MCTLYGRSGLEVLPVRASPSGVSFVDCPREIDETHLYSELAHNGGNNAKPLLQLLRVESEGGRSLGISRLCTVHRNSAHHATEH